MLSAISFGVFCREAPSTSAIIRSRKVSPGCCVTRTTIWSESTRVPPVTAERSPPDSRITGADSPVIADSSTLAIPSITSPSAGISSPADTTTTSPSARRARRDAPRACRRARRRCATVSARVRRSVSACALPRPSAIASAKLAKQHGEPEPDRDQPGEDGRRRRSRFTVTSTLPSSTTNITGLRAIRRGSSLRTLSRAARREDRRIEQGGRRRVTGRAAPRSGRGRAPGST